MYTAEDDIYHALLERRIREYSAAEAVVQQSLDLIDVAYQLTRPEDVACVIDAAIGAIVGTPSNLREGE